MQVQCIVEKHTLVQENGPILPYYLECRGNESSLADCNNLELPCYLHSHQRCRCYLPGHRYMKKYYAPCTVMSS